MTSTPRPRLTAGVNVLSWDCGMTNLCYCFLEHLVKEEGQTKEFRIVKWSNFSLHADNIKDAAESLVYELNRRPWMLDVDYVCIESQVIKNTQMKCLSHIIQTYFLTRNSTSVQFSIDGTSNIAPPRGPTVHFVEAKSKFNVCSVPEPKIQSRRLRNKRVAVLMAQKLLTDQNDVTTLKFLNSFDKKDDLSDSFVQGLYFLRLLKSNKKNARTIKNHLGLNTEPEGIVISLNEGCEIDDEIPLPKTYRRETYSDPIYNLMEVEPSECYKKPQKGSSWSST